MNIENYSPMSPSQGPPLPRLLAVRWPWVAAKIRTASLSPDSTGIAVTSTPGGATVTINGTTYGTTPLSVGVPSGNYVVRATLYGYAVYTYSVAVIEGRTSQVEATLYGYLLHTQTVVSSRVGPVRCRLRCMATFFIRRR